MRGLARLVDPERDAIDVYRRATGHFSTPMQFAPGDVFSTPLLPGLELPVNSILADRRV
jgi:Uma2 family endonuclease